MGRFKIVLLVLVAIVSTGIVLTRVPAFHEGRLQVGTNQIMQRSFPESENLRIYVCASASPLGIAADRAQACIAVITPEHFFLFDAGENSVGNLQGEGLPLERLDGIFLTHFHSDHIPDLPDARLASWVAGRKNDLKVYGPLGVVQVVEGFNQVYEFDNHYRNRHHGEELLPLHLGKLHGETIMSGVVYDSGGLTVTMFKVIHAPIHPAMGFLVEYAGRKVVISGDSIVADELFKYAAGADLLFDDALSPEALEPMMAGVKEAGRDRIAKIIHDVMDYHAHVGPLQEASKAAGVKQLALYHMVPTPTNPMLNWIWQREMDADTVMVDDGMVFELTPVN